MNHGSVILHNCKTIRLKSYNKENSNSLGFEVKRNDDTFEIDLFDLPDDVFYWIVMCFGKDAKDYSKV